MNCLLIVTVYMVNRNVTSQATDLSSVQQNSINFLQKSYPLMFVFPLGYQQRGPYRFSATETIDYYLHIFKYQLSIRLMFEGCSARSPRLLSMWPRFQFSDLLSCVFNLLVLYSALRGFHQGTLVFPSALTQAAYCIFLAISVDWYEPTVQC